LVSHNASRIGTRPSKLSILPLRISRTCTTESFCCQSFDLSFDGFCFRRIIQGLSEFGQGLQDFAAALTACGDTRIAQAMQQFIADLISCATASECYNFVIDVVEDNLIVAYLRTHEIFGDIKAASNNWAAKEYEEAGLNSGRVIAAIIAPIRDAMEFKSAQKQAAFLKHKLSKH